MELHKNWTVCMVLFAMISVAKANLNLTVNGLDTSMPVEVKPDDDIIIAVVGQTGEEESYSLTCKMGGKVEPLEEPNTSSE